MVAPNSKLRLQKLGDLWPRRVVLHWVGVPISCPFREDIRLSIANAAAFCKFGASSHAIWQMNNL